MKNDNWKLYYDDNLIKVSSSDDSVDFGTLKINGNPETFLGKELLFHTPSDHEIAGKKFDLEVQAIYEASDKNSNHKTAVSFLFEKEPGKVSDFINKLDLTRIPNVV
jgi:carbonic anhydrase